MKLDGPDIYIVRWVIEPCEWRPGDASESLHGARIDSKWHGAVSGCMWSGMPDGALWCPMELPADD
jgi:hypothetical protein